MGEVLVLVESNTTGTGRLFAESALAMGLEPHMLCEDSGRYPYLGDLGIPSHRVRTAVTEDVLAAVRVLSQRHDVCGVTSSSEYFIGTAARIARATGLPGEDPDRLERARDKGVQREAFGAAGIRAPGHRLATGPAEAADAARELGMPVVLKPVDRSGSLGVLRCDDATAVAAHARTLLATTHDERGRPLPGRLLVETYLSGPEFSVEILAGRARAVVAKTVDETHGFLETGHDVPAHLTPQIREALETTALAALAALGLGWGAAHVELRLVDGVPAVIEVNPRLAGGMIPVALRAATGQDLVHEFVARTAGRDPAPTPAGPGYAAVRFVVPAHGGVVTRVPGTAPVLALPGVVSAAVTARPGQTVELRGCFLDRVGHVIAVGADQQEAAHRAARGAARLQPLVAALADRTGASAQP